MYYVYNARADGNFIIERLKANFYRTKNIEKEISKNDPKRILKHSRKCSPIDHILD